MKINAVERGSKKRRTFIIKEIGKRLGRIFDLRASRKSPGYYKYIRMGAAASITIEDQIPLRKAIALVRFACG